MKTSTFLLGAGVILTGGYIFYKRTQSEIKRDFYELIIKWICNHLKKRLPYMSETDIRFWTQESLFSQKMIYPLDSIREISMKLSKANDSHVELEVNITRIPSDGDGSAEITNLTLNQLPWENLPPSLSHDLIDDPRPHSYVLAK